MRDFAPPSCLNDTLLGNRLLHAISSLSKTAIRRSAWFGKPLGARDLTSRDRWRTVPNDGG